MFKIMPSFKKNFDIRTISREFTLNLTNMETAIGEKAPVNDFGRTVPVGEKYCCK